MAWRDIEGTASASLLSTQVASAATTAVVTEETLWTYTLPANSFTSSSNALRLTFFYTTAVNNNTKTVKVYFGGTAVATRAAADNGRSAMWTTLITRVAANSQYSATQKVAPLLGAPDASAVPGVELTATSITESAAIIIKVTGQNGTASAGDITLYGLTLEFVQ